MQAVPSVDRNNVTASLGGSYWLSWSSCNIFDNIFWADSLYVENRPCMHGSLVWVRNFKEPEGQLARWLERLEEYDFTVNHRRGSQHSNADALSRGPCKQYGRSSHSHSCGAEAAVAGAATPTRTSRSAAQKRCATYSHRIQSLGLCLQYRSRRN